MVAIAKGAYDARVAGGRREYANARSILRGIEAEYGVPGEILIAIWGHETSYGAVRGSFDLVRSLATLAWDGRRRELFERELIDVLKRQDTRIVFVANPNYHGGKLGLSRLPPANHKTLQLTGLANHASIYADEESAVTEMGLS